MRKSFLTFVLFIAASGLCISVFAQDPLTIAEAVSAGNGEFATENIKDLVWIPGTTNYSFREDREGKEVITIGNVDTRPVDAMIELESLAQAFEKAGVEQPSRIPSFEWLDSKTIGFAYLGRYWTYDRLSKTIQDKFAYLDAMGDKSISPDHSKVAGTLGTGLYYSDMRQDSVLVNADTEEGQVSGTAVSRYEFGISKGIFWSPHSDQIAYYHKDESAVGKYALQDYTALPAATNEIRYPMAGLGSETIEVRVFDTRTGKTITLKTDSEEGEYFTSVTWTADGKNILLGELDRAQDHFSLVTYDAVTGERKKTLFSESDNKYVEPEQEPYLIPGSTKGEFLWFSERDGYNHIYHYDGQGKLIRKLTSGSRVMQSILHYDSRSRVLYVQGTDSPLETVVYRVSLKGGKMTRLTAEKGTHTVSFTDNGAYFFDSYRSLTVPRDITIKDKKGKVIRKLLSAPDATAEKLMGTTEVFPIKAKDGTDLYCRMIKPSDFDSAKKYPVLVYVYNGPHVQLVKDTWLGGASLWMHHLAEQGYLIFTLDGRGSMNRGRDFEQAVHGKLGELETQDQMEGVAYLKSLPYVDSERMAIHGWSFGGFMTLNLMLKQAGTFKVGVAGGAVTDWKFYEVMYTERYMETPEVNPEGYENSKVTSDADKLQGKLLMIHGTNDDVVVPQQFMTMVRSFVEAEKQMDVFVYPGHAHNVRGKDRIHLMTKIIDYVEQNL